MPDPSPQEPSPLDSEARRALVELRLQQVKEGVPRAIRAEVAWLRKHNFPIWVWRDGKLYDDNDFTRGKAEYGSHL